MSISEEACTPLAESSRDHIPKPRVYHCGDCTVWIEHQRLIRFSLHHVLPLQELDANKVAAKKLPANGGHRRRTRDTLGTPTGDTLGTLTGSANLAKDKDNRKQHFL